MTGVLYEEDVFEFIYFLFFSADSKVKDYLDFEGYTLLGLAISVGPPLCFYYDYNY